MPTIFDVRDAFLDDVAQRRGRSANTMHSHHSDLTMLAHKLEGSLDTITRRDLEWVLISRQEEPANTNRRIASFKQFFGWCRHEGGAR